MAATFDAGALILAGGESRRMGANKSLLDFGGIPLIQHIAAQLLPHFPQVSIVANAPDTFAFLKLPVITDRTPGQGPLMGIATGLDRSEYPWNLVVATDIPTIPLPLLHALFAARAERPCVVPREASGTLQPLCGLYHRDATDEILSFLSRGEHRVMALVEKLAPTTVPVDTGLLRNLNTPEEYRRHPH